MTDVVQATVVAGSALRAESLAKAAVIAGSVDGFALLERARVRGAVLVTSNGEVRALPVTMSLLGNLKTLCSATSRRPRSKARRGSTLRSRDRAPLPGRRPAMN